ncbi:type I-E CRISPR-associated protein Cse1/CasA [Microbulbifer sp. ANSA001]|uniref:type I-E CRISPR-associated protein Cse1/CasA n=1 Tax=Microbulbifer sp. ANSA001 TaxID=3243358 RepID=UPI00404197E5
MNLISDSWIPVIRQDGARVKVTPWQITDRDNSILDIVTVRADFRGALYQFLIGLLQTTFAPRNVNSWGRLYQESPSPESLKAVFSYYENVFELMAWTEPAFMQDLGLVTGESKPVVSLLIEAPGNKTCKANLDHFIKCNQVQGICPSCVATALLTLQINAPSGGLGHRTSLRGGGPLTTLLMSSSDESSLWQKLWLNVLPMEEIPTRPSNKDTSVFPWLAPTRLSNTNGMPTYPEDTHPLQMYWSMPRRIRLDLATLHIGSCDLCGEHSSSLLSHFISKNYGVNYDGAWLHPLTPYRFDPKKKSPPISLKGQRDAIGYQRWLGLLWHDDTLGDRASATVHYFNKEYGELINEQTGGNHLSLWCFGYDMDNMKARYWSEYQMPVILVKQHEQVHFVEQVSLLIKMARDVLKALRFYIKSVWFPQYKEAKGNLSFIDRNFWRITEPEFYKMLNILSTHSQELKSVSQNMIASWYRTLKTVAEENFDRWILDNFVEDLNQKRVFGAREGLQAKLSRMARVNLLDSDAEFEQGESVMASYQFLKSEDVSKLRAWHTWLNTLEGRADRARLRRAVEPMDALVTSAFIRFLKAMPDRWQNNEDIRLEDAALVATLAAHVSSDTPRDVAKTIAHSLATVDEGNGRPVMSEMRFSQLQRSRDTPEFYRRLVRALRLLSGKADIASLANDLLHWQHERRVAPVRNVRERLAVRWATDYYARLLDY